MYLARILVQYIGTETFDTGGMAGDDNAHMVLRHKYQIVMWDLVTRDYSNKLNGRQVLRKVKHYVRNGSIITFHDSIKAEKNMKYALPRAIEWLLEQGYEFKVFD